MTTDLASPGPWRVDPDRSTVGWSVKHLGVSTIHGTFRTFEGALQDGRATGAVAAASIHSDDDQRDAFVRSDEFLGADAFPLLQFDAQVTGDGDAALDGELTIRDATLPLTLHVEGVESGAETLELQLRGSVRRRAYGLRFHQAMGAADRSVGDEVQLELDLVLVPRD